MFRLAFRQALPLARRSTLPAFASASRPAPVVLRARWNSTNAAAGNTPKILKYEEVKKRAQRPTQDAYLIDVREADEVAQGSIPSAVSVPLSVLPNSLTMKPDEFFLKFGFLKPKRDQEAVFYCRSGKRSATACDIAFKNGFTNVNNYEGSWLDWVEKERGPSSS